MPFQKGYKGGPGRPKGCKNKNYTNINVWLELIYERVPNMTPVAVINAAFRAVELLVPKIASLPATPNDSVENAKTAIELIRSIEERPGGPNGNGPQ